MCYDSIFTTWSIFKLCQLAVLSFMAYFPGPPPSPGRHMRLLPCWPVFCEAAILLLHRL